MNEKEYVNDMKRKIFNIEILTPEESVELFKIAKSDENAKQKLIHHNLRLVLNFAMKYSTSDTELLELFDFGVEKLIGCINSYDYKKGNAFSTYVTPVLKKEMLSYKYNNDKFSSLSSSSGLGNRKIKQLNRIIEKLQMELNKEPSSLEIANKMGLEVWEVESLLLQDNNFVSLDSAKYEDTDESLIDYITNKEDDTEEKLDNKEFEDLSFLLFINALETSGLTAKEREVLIERYVCLNDGRMQTFSEISEKYRSSKQDISKCHKSAVKKLKRNDAFNELAKHRGYK